MKKILKDQNPITFRRKFKRKKGSKKWNWKQAILITFASCMMVFLVLGFLGAGFLFFKYSKDLPDVRSLKEYQPSTITRVYSDQDELIAEFYIEKRILVPMSKIPKKLIQATLAVEDSNFYSHFGIDPKAIFRAFLTNVQAGHVVEGGSTITQQLSKTLFLSAERSLERKIREAILAIRMELIFQKDEILELYLNNIYYGHGSYGVEAASRTYFGKHVEDLNVDEAATLAALPKAPNHYSPYKDAKKAKRRRNHVLKRMAHQGYITEQEKVAFMEKDFKLGELTDMLNKAPYFVEYIRQFIEDNYGSNKLYRDGLKIYTTLNYDRQDKAQRAVQVGLRRADKRYGYRGPVGKTDIELGIENWDRALNAFNEKDPESPKAGDIIHGLVVDVDTQQAKVYLSQKSGIIDLENMNWARKPNIKIDGRWARIISAHTALEAGDIILVRLLKPRSDVDWDLALEQMPEVEGGLISLEPQTGHIQAMVGGYDFSKSQFNRAVQAVRQPGSSFKPIIYAAAMEDGYTPASIIIDSPVIFKEKEDTFDKWKPVNFEQKFYGPTSIRTALTHSRNVVTIKLLQSTGVQKAIDLARRLGISSHLEDNLSIALGSSGMTLFEIVSSYAVFANLGKRVEPTAVRFIKNREEEIIYRSDPAEHQALSSGVAHLITSMLQSVVRNGTATKVKALKRPVAGKTGTTNNFIDAWFLGYTPRLVTGVWVGKDQDESLGVNETGSRAAIPIWLQYMQEALKGEPVRNFPVPDDVVLVKMDPETGHAADFENPNARFEVFLRENPPDKARNETDMLERNTF